MADDIVGTDAPIAESTGSPSIAGSESGGVTAEDVAGIAATLGSGEAATPSAVPAPQGAGQQGVAPRRTPGGIPYDRHKQILENTRKAAAEEAEARVRQTYGLTSDATPDVVKHALGIANWLGTDPEGVATAIQQQLKRHPGQTTKQAADAVEAKIEAALRSEDGKAVYTAEQVDQMFERRAQELERKIRADYEPLREKEQKREQTEYINQRATQVLTHYRQYPHFRELEKEMKPLVEKGVPLVEAYAYLLATKKIPQATHVTQQQTDASQQLARKANAKNTGAARDPVSGQFVKPTEMETIDVVRQVARELIGRL